MSIAAVAKEVTTIMVSAIVFGDELTPLNITGVGITISGKSLFGKRMFECRSTNVRNLSVHISQIPSVNRLSRATGCAWKPYT